MTKPREVADAIYGIFILVALLLATATGVALVIWLWRTALS